MGALIREGLWIPLVFLVAAVLYALWAAYRLLGGLRERGQALEEGLGESLVHYRVALERTERAGSWIESGDVDRAIQELEEVQRFSPGFQTAHYFLGKAYLLKANLPTAREHFRMFVDKTRPWDRVSRERLDEVQSILSGLG
jgi:hypothetical protein